MKCSLSDLVRRREVPYVAGCYIWSRLSCLLCGCRYHWLGYVIGRRDVIQLRAVACCQHALSLCLHVAKSSSSLHLIGDTYLDLFACGGCGYRLSLVTETPTPYVPLGLDILRMSVNRLALVRGFCGDDGKVVRRVQWRIQMSLLREIQQVFRRLE